MCYLKSTENTFNDTTTGSSEKTANEKKKTVNR